MVLSVFLLSVVPRGELRAQGTAAELVVNVRGPSSQDARALGRSVRRRLADAVGPLKSSRQWKRSLRSLGLSGPEKNRAVNIARAGRMVGANHILDLKVFSEEGQRMLKVRLIRTFDGTIRMRRHLRFARGRTAAANLADRVIRLSLLTLAREGVSVDENPPAALPDDVLPDATVAIPAESADQVTPAPREAPATAVVPPPLESPDDDGPEDREPEDARDVEAPLAANDDGEVVDAPRGVGAAPSLDMLAAPREGREEDDDTIESPSKTEPAPPNLEPEPDESEPATAATRSPTDTPPVRVDGRPRWFAPDETPPPTPTDTGLVLPDKTSTRQPRTLHLTVGFGSGVFRDYRLRTDAVGTSALSYTLSPVIMFRAAAQVIIPSWSFGFDADVAFRTLQFQVDGVAAERQELTGFFFDADVAAVYRIRTTRLDIIPKLGLRIGVASVEDPEAEADGAPAPDSVIVGALALAPLVGLDLIVRGQIWDLRIGAAGAYVLSYEEHGGRTGDGGQGPSLSGSLGLTVWVTEEVGLMVDGRFTADLLSFDGEPTRALPTAEEGRLTDAQLTVLDVVATGGARLRF